MPRPAIDRLADLIEEHYVFPQTAREIAAGLRATTFPDLEPSALVGPVRAYLREHDRHLSLVDRASTPDSGPARLDFTDPEVLRRSNYGVRQVEIHDGNVARLDLTMLCDADQNEVRSTVAAALALTANADAVVVDLRQVPGGWPSGGDLLLGHFLPAEPVHLLTMTDRSGNGEAVWSAADNSYGHRPDLPLVVLVVLVDERSASAAECFAYVAQSLGRGTVVGRPTAGAANPGDFFDVDDRLTAFIPTLAPIDPRTGTNWEGAGVQPDVVVADAAEAVARAVALAASG